MTATHTSSMVEVPADVRDNSATVTDYAFMRYRSLDKGVRTLQHRDADLDCYRRWLAPNYTVYSWDDVNPDGQRCRFDRVIRNGTGVTAALYHTEYYTRVTCAPCTQFRARSYATYFAVVNGADRSSDPIPVCDEHLRDLRRSLASWPTGSITLSEPLRIGQHD